MFLITMVDQFWFQVVSIEDSNKYNQGRIQRQLQKGYLLKTQKDQKIVIIVIIQRI